MAVTINIGSGAVPKAGDTYTLDGVTEKVKVVEVDQQAGYNVAKNGTTLIPVRVHVAFERPARVRPEPITEPEPGNRHHPGPEQISAKEFAAALTPSEPEPEPEPKPKAVRRTPRKR